VREIAMGYFVNHEIDPVLYRINWDLSHWHYQLDMGTHSQEAEILLYDGTLLYIDDIGWEKINKPQ
jgi:hypothetical protein